MDDRLDRDLWAMAMAILTSTRATCNRRQVGAVLLAPNGRILSTGYNGPVRGEEHCHHELDSAGCQAAVHAEANALCNLLLLGGGTTQGATCYVTLSPCLNCAHLLVAAGVTRIVWKENYRRPDGVDWLQDVGRVVNDGNFYIWSSEQPILT